MDSVREKEKTAERLFTLSLKYASNHRAYLGLGIMKQRKGEYRQSIRILSEGVKYFPGSEDLNVGLGISYMNVQDYQAALACFSKFPESKPASAGMTRCRDAMKNS
jgi:anaerobic magnesium-protoporphyrin IX monomethyl ester cyclase